MEVVFDSGEEVATTFKNDLPVRELIDWKSAPSNLDDATLQELLSALTPWAPAASADGDDVAARQGSCVFMSAATFDPRRPQLCFIEGSVLDKGKNVCGGAHQGGGDPSLTER